MSALSVQEPLFAVDDEPRARRSDPANSHRAAEKSGRGLSKLRIAVLRLIAMEGPLIGSEINAIYRDEVSLSNDRRMLPTAAWDSPRKRAGELHAKFGYLDHVGDRAGSSTTPEAEYRINDAGWAELRRAAS